MKKETPRFPVGTQYRPIGKDYLCTVTDYYVTRNMKGEIVRTCYASTHEFCGQIVPSYDVVEVTIARGIIAAAA